MLTDIMEEQIPACKPEEIPMDIIKKKQILNNYVVKPNIY